MRYLLVGKGGGDPSTRYRLRPIERALTARGHQTMFMEGDTGFAGKMRMLAAARASDVVIIQRKLFAAPFVMALHRCCDRLVFDFDDAVFLRSDGTPSASRGGRFDRIARRAALIWAGNTYLGAAAAQAGARVIHLVPTAVRLADYEQPAERDAGFTLVWIGSRSTSRYLESHRDCLEAIGQQHPEVRLRVVADFALQLESLAVENVPWTEAGEARALTTAHAGLAPMTDDAWTRGKCALKVLQYMAAGLPVISSRVGANAEIVREGATGLFAGNPEQWAAAVTSLRGSLVLRETLGRAGREVVRDRYDESVVVESALMSLMEHRLLD